MSSSSILIILTLLILVLILITAILIAIMAVIVAGAERLLKFFDDIIGFEGYQEDIFRILIMVAIFGIFLSFVPSDILIDFVYTYATYIFFVAFVIGFFFLIGQICIWFYEILEDYSEFVFRHVVARIAVGLILMGFAYLATGEVVASGGIALISSIVIYSISS